MSTFLYGDLKIDLKDDCGNLYRLRIEHDHDPLNPRTDWDNVGTMVCWHGRYDLGDKHDHDNPRDFLREKLFSLFWTEKMRYGKRIYDFIKSGKAEEARLIYDRSAREWVLSEKSFVIGNWYDTSSYSANLKGKDVPDCFLDECLGALTTHEMIDFLNNLDDIVVLPLYLYDHSGITISTGAFSCQWDSGQVGWIYVEKEKALYEWALKDNRRWKEEAKRRLVGEVEVYDRYLTGSVYGFILEQEIREEDAAGNKDDVTYDELESCWGFFADTLEESGIMDHIGYKYKVA